MKPTLFLILFAAAAQVMAQPMKVNLSDTTSFPYSTNTQWAINIMGQLFTDYKKYCWNDSVVEHQFKDVGDTHWYNSDGYLFNVDDTTGTLKFRNIYHHSHKPDFNDFMDWFIKQQRKDSR